MKLIIAVTGMPGSGKSTVAKAISEHLGYPLMVMGDVVRGEVARRGLPLTSENVERVARELRDSLGEGAVAALMASDIKSMESEGVVIDGVRSPGELDVFRRLGRVCVVAVLAPPSVRIRRVSGRGRPGEARTLEDFESRDRYNLQFGVGEVIALSDYYLVNIGDIGSLVREARRVAEAIRSGRGEGCS